MTLCHQKINYIIPTRRGSTVCLEIRGTPLLFNNFALATSIVVYISETWLSYYMSPIESSQWPVNKKSTGLISLDGGFIRFHSIPSQSMGIPIRVL